jgi:hypothetical protein
MPQGRRSAGAKWLRFGHCVIASYGDAVADKPTKGPGGKQPLGNLARRSPALSLAAALLEGIQKHPVGRPEPLANLLAGRVEERRQTDKWNCPDKCHGSIR